MTEIDCYQGPSIQHRPIPPRIHIGYRQTRGYLIYYRPISRSEFSDAEAAAFGVFWSTLAFRLSERLSRAT